METRANYVLLGAVSIVGIALLMLFAMWLARAQWSTEYATYDVVFEGAVRGLANGGEVRFNGIKVGEVERLRIDEDDEGRVIARVRISADTPVKSDSVGQLEQIGLTGVTLIQLSAGDPNEDILRQGLGQPVPRIQGRPDPVAEIFEAGGDIATRASQALAAAQGFLTEENIARLSATVANIETITGAVASQAEQLEQAGAAVVALRDSGQEIAALARDARATLARIDANGTEVMTDAGRAVTSIADAAERAERLIAELETTATEVNSQTLPEMTMAAQDVRRLSVALERLAAEVEEDPYGFVFQRSRPTIEVRP